MDKRKEIIKYRFSDPQRAYDICCELLAQGIASGNDYEIAYAYLYMGDTLFSLSNLDEAVRYLEKAEKIQKQNNFENLLMITYNIMGVLYMTKGDLLIALDYYHLALVMAKKMNEYSVAAMVYNNVGAILSNIGDLEKAVEYFNQAYECINKLESDGNKFVFDIILLHMNVCEEYITEKRYDDAKKYLDDALSTIDKNQLSPVDQMKIFRDYAMIYYNQKDYENAYEMCVKAAKLCKADWKDIEIFDNYVEIVKIMINTGHEETVLKIIDEMDKIAEQTDIDSRRLRICKLRIELYNRINDREKQKEQLRRYYEIKKKQESSRNKIIISAIDNRCRLEEEKEKNRRLKEKNQILARESEIDELTGIYNRYAFERRYDKLYRYAADEQSLYCVGILDIDSFKEYNDTYGHLKGDECIKRVASILRNTSGGDFCVARYGGDEFVFMAYDRDDEEIRDFVRRLIAGVRHENIEKVTISIGVILKPAAEGEKLSSLIKKADKVLYEVKQSGKDGYKIRIE